MVREPSSRNQKIINCGGCESNRLKESRYSYLSDYKKYMKHPRIETEPDMHIFSSQTHEHMTISCVEEIYKKYIKLAKEKAPELFKEKHFRSAKRTTGKRFP